MVVGSRLKEVLVFRKLAIAVVLLALPLVSHAAEPVKQEQLLGAWAGAMVVNANGHTFVAPVEFTFRSDGKVELVNRGGGKDDRETQTWKLDAAKRQITFHEAKGGKLDATFDVTVLDAQSLVGKIRPPADKKAPAEVTMDLYLGRLAAK